MIARAKKLVSSGGKDVGKILENLRAILSTTLHLGLRNRKDTKVQGSKRARWCWHRFMVF
jgi:hypothetical protein